MKQAVNQFVDFARMLVPEVIRELVFVIGSSGSWMTA
jgi:hypothetical protein